MSHRKQVRLAGSVLDRFRHLCAFFHQLRTHRIVILGGVLQENPFFVPPDEFLRELRERTGQTSTGVG